MVFWGGREGYSTLLNTDAKRELDHMATLFRMAVAHKKAIGFKGQLLIEPKPKEPTKHQYDYDAQTVVSFLKTYGLDKDFKLNIEVIADAHATRAPSAVHRLCVSALRPASTHTTELLHCRLQCSSTSLTNCCLVRASCSRPAESHDHGWSFVRARR